MTKMTFKVKVNDTHFPVIFWLLEGQNWVNTAQKLISSEH